MGALRDDNYFVVHGWMINQLELKGTELQIYAILYGFTQADGQRFEGGMQYLADWTNSNRRTVMRCLQSMTEKGLIIKEDVNNRGVRMCNYYCTPLDGGDGDKMSLVVTNCRRGGDKLSPGVVTNCPSGGDKMSPHKEIYNKYNKEVDKEGASTPAPPKASRFTPPTVEDVKRYCRERGNRVDAAAFVAYYESTGWMRGKTKIKDWKACVRTWESRERSTPARTSPQTACSTVKTDADYAAGVKSDGFGWG